MVVERTFGDPWVHRATRAVAVEVSWVREWDRWSDWEKRLRFGQIVGMLILLTVPLAGFVFLLRATVAHWGIVLPALCTVAAFPSILLLLAFVGFLLEGFEVVASLWRTRISSHK